MSLEFIGKFCVMRKKNDRNFEHKLTYQFTIDIKNLINFDASTRKSQTFAL